MLPSPFSKLELWILVFSLMHYCIVWNKRLVDFRDRIFSCIINNMSKIISRLFLAIIVLFSQIAVPSYASDGAGRRYDVYIIEDLHYDVTCQKQIVSIVNRLIRDVSARAVFLEGAGFSRIYPEEYFLLRGLVPSAYLRLCKRLLEKEIISAGEFLVLTHRGDIEFLGLEDMGLYKNHLRLYADIFPLIKHDLLKREGFFGRAFLGLARQRDIAFAQNILRYLSNTKQRPIITICGGFHSKGLSSILKAHHLRVKVIRPRVYYISKESRAFYRDRLYYLGRDALALPVKVFSDWGDLYSSFFEDFTTRLSPYLKRFFSVYRRAPPDNGLANSHLRVPRPLWDRLKHKLRQIDIGNKNALYYLIRGSGYAWTDAVGRIHFIDEIVDDDAENLLLWSALAGVLTGFYGKDKLPIEQRIKFARSVVSLHERIHAELKKSPQRLKEVLVSLRRILGKNYGNYIEWTRNIYGRIPRNYNLKGKALENWYLEEFLTVLLQERILRGRGYLKDYTAFLDRSDIPFPEDKDKFISKAGEAVDILIEKIFSGHVPGLRVFVNAGYAGEEALHSDNKKVRRLYSILNEICGTKAFPDGETYLDHALRVYRKAESFYPNASVLKYSSLLHILYLFSKREINSAFKRGRGIKEDFSSIEDVLKYICHISGMGSKETVRVEEIVRTARDLYNIDIKLDEGKSLPSKDYIDRVLRFYVQVSKGNIWAMRLFMLDAIASLRAEGVLKGRERQKLLKKVKYIYIPLAEMIGERQLFSEMKDILFLEEDRRDFYICAGKLREILNRRSEERIIDELKTLFYGFIPGFEEMELSFRVKSVGSIVEKLKRREYGLTPDALDRLRDIIGCKIVVQDFREAKRIAGILSETFAKEKDITSVDLGLKQVEGYRYYVFQFRFSSVPVELQIRSRDVDRYLEQGERSHWIYNLKKVLPPLWKDQTFTLLLSDKREPREVLKDLYKETWEKPVFLVTQTWPKRFSLLDRKQFLDLIRRQINRNRHLYAFPLSEVHSKMLDRIIFKKSIDFYSYDPNRILEDAKEHPELVFVVEREMDISFFKKKLMQNKDIIFGVLALSFSFLSSINLWHSPYAFLVMSSLYSRFNRQEFVIKVSDARNIICRKRKDGYYGVEEDIGGVRHKVGQIRIMEQEKGHWYVEDKTLLDAQALGALLDFIAKQREIESLEVFAGERASVWNQAIESAFSGTGYQAKDRVYWSRRQASIPVCIRRAFAVAYPYLSRDLRSSILKASDISDCVPLLQDAIDEISARMEKERRLNGLELDADDVLYTLESALLKTKDIFMEVDVGEVAKDLVNEMKKRYPEVEIELHNKLGKVLTYSELFKIAFRRLLENACKHGRSRVYVELYYEGSQIVVFLQDYGKGIPSGFRPRVFKESFAISWQDASAGGRSLLNIKDMVDKVGGSIKFASLSQGEVVGSYNKENIAWQERIKASPESRGTIFELRLPALWKGGWHKRPFSDVFVVTGGLGTGRRFIARWLATKFGMYYINLDGLLLRFLIEGLYKGDDAFWRSCVLAMEQSHSTKVKEIEDGLAGYIRENVGRLRYEREGIFWRGANMNYFLSEFPLWQYISQMDKDRQGVFFYVWETYAKDLAVLLYNALRENLSNTKLNRWGYKGLVVRSSFPLYLGQYPNFNEIINIPVFSRSADDAVRRDFSKGFVNKVRPEFWENLDIYYLDPVDDSFPVAYELLSKALSKEDSLFALLVWRWFNGDNRLLMEKVQMGAFDEMEGVLLGDYPFELKRAFLRQLHVTAYGRASIERPSGLRQFLVDIIRDRKVDPGLIEDLHEAIRYCYLTEVVDLVKNRVISMMGYVFNRKLRDGEIKEKGLDLIRRIQENLDNIKELCITDCPREYEKLLSSIDETYSLLSRVEESVGERDRKVIASLLDTLDQARGLLKSSMYSVYWIGDPVVNGIERPSIFKLEWPRDKSLPIEIYVYVPEIKAYDFDKMRRSIERNVLVRAVLVRVRKVGDPWPGERFELSLNLEGIERMGWKKNLKYAGQIDLDQLGPGVYELNFYVVFPGGKLWWDEGQRVKSEENPFGNIVLKVRLGGEQAKQGLIERLKNKGLIGGEVSFVELNDYGDGSVVTEEETGAQEGKDIDISLYSIRGLSRVVVGGGLKVWVSQGGKVSILNRRGILDKLRILNFGSIDQLLSEIQKIIVGYEKNGEKK